MPSRLKTRMTPDEQWSSTVRYDRYLHNSDSAAHRLSWKARYAATTIGVSDEGRASEVELRQLMLAERHLHEIVPRAGRSAAAIAVITRPHRWLHVGDVFRVTAVNGMNESSAVNGVSSKGVRLNGCYLRLDHGVGKGVMQTFVLPESLVGLRWDDDAVRQFVNESRAQVLGR